MTTEELTMLSPDEIEDLEHLFSYHAPSPLAVERMRVLRDKAKEFAGLILAHCPRSADRAAALRYVREAVMTANASIVLGGRNFR